MHSVETTKPSGHFNRKTLLFALLFIVITAAGLLYVKWWPYYGKAITSATTHSIGSSILTGAGDTIPAPSWSAAWEYAAAYFKAVWKAAVLGILLGSLVQVLLPSKWLLDMLGKANFKSTAIGGLASLPGMMCSCCAAPLAVGLRKKKASIGASLAFWIGNPTINPATLIFMTFVLSWEFTLLRLVFGLLLTFGVSYLANRFAPNELVPQQVEAALPEDNEPEQPMYVRWGKAMWSMFISVIPAYVLVVLMLGAFRAWLFPAMDGAGSNSLLAIIGFAIAGMLFVIPTAAEIPIIQSFMDMGMGGGPAAALLMTLPAISLPSLLMLAKHFPGKVLAFTASSVVAIGILAGLVGWMLL
ncbi:permease [Paenibacillus cisolokensis]|uniref:permease n=1 Tax=Paenibacillus cisolokensis TaxID=1658519 RepID=UPI003D2C3874